MTSFIFSWLWNKKSTIDSQPLLTPEVIEPSPEDNERYVQTILEALVECGLLLDEEIVQVASTPCKEEEIKQETR